MSTYEATATREGKWWIVEVDGLGVTQGRTATEAETMAADLVASMLDIPVEEIEVEVTFEVPGAHAAEIREVRAATRRAAEAQAEVARRSRQAVAGLKADGLSGSDIAKILGLSKQRVSQLLKGA